MNKELILAFKDEFDYWVRGGKLLGRFNYTNIKNYKPEPWFEFEEIKWSLASFEYLNIIIDDEYVEFRKAVADGKTVQCQNRFAGEWIDIPDVKFYGKPSDYRVKPDEPKYEIGDWVVLHFSHLEDKDDCPTQIRGIKDGVYYNDADCTSPIEEGTEWYIIGYWKPKAGERCYFYNRGIKNLGTFLGMNGNFYLGNIQDYYEAGFLNCEPALSNVQFNKVVPRKKLDRIRRGDVCWYPSIGDGGVRVGRVLEVNDTHITFNTGSIVKREYVYLFKGDIPLDIIEELNKEKFRDN